MGIDSIIQCGNTKTDFPSRPDMVTVNHIELEEQGMLDKGLTASRAQNTKLGKLNNCV